MAGDRAVLGCGGTLADRGHPGGESGSVLFGLAVGFAPGGAGAAAVPVAANRPADGGRAAARLGAVVRTVAFSRRPVGEATAVGLARTPRRAGRRHHREYRRCRLEPARRVAAAAPPPACAGAGRDTSSGVVAAQVLVHEPEVSLPLRDQVVGRPGQQSAPCGCRTSQRRGLPARPLTGVASTSWAVGRMRSVAVHGLADGVAGAVHQGGDRAECHVGLGRFHTRMRPGGRHGFGRLDTLGQ